MAATLTMILLCRCANAVASAWTRAIAPAQSPELGGRHHRRGRPEMLEDQLGLGVPDRVDEHRACRRERTVLGVIGRIDLRVGHGPDHVGERRRQRAEGRYRLLTVLVGPAWTSMARMTTSPWCSSGMKGIGGAVITVAIVDRSSGSRLGGRHEAGDGLGRRGQDEHAARDRVQRVELELEARDDAEVAAAAADRPEEVRVALVVDLQDPAVGENDLGGEQVVVVRPCLRTR